MDLSSYEKIKEQIPIADFLKRLGYSPVRHSEQKSRYFSMIRDDGRYPAFDVYHLEGRWWDYGGEGKGKGGTIIDLAMEIFKITKWAEVIGKFNQIYNGHIPVVPTEFPKRSSLPSAPKHEIISISPLGRSKSLLDYLDSRGILKEAIESGMLREVRYHYIKDDGSKKQYFGIGWQNIAGGWEVRNPYGKICLSPKDILVKPGLTARVNIFEGMMDYLSALKENPLLANDHLYVLNTTGLTSRAIYKLEDQPNIRQIDLYLDNGNGGRSHTTDFKAAFPHAVDKAYLYKGFDDYNDKIKAALKQEQNPLLKIDPREPVRDERSGPRR